MTVIGEKVLRLIFIFVFPNVDRLKFPALLHEVDFPWILIGYIIV